MRRPTILGRQLPRSAPTTITAPAQAALALVSGIAFGLLQSRLPRLRGAPLRLHGPCYWILLISSLLRIDTGRLLRTVRFMPITARRLALPAPGHRAALVIPIKALSLPPGALFSLDAA